MEKLRILFVDDDVRLLDGLRRNLRKQRGHWDLLFCSSTDEALAIVASQDIGVIVADMRMPGMSGAELLKNVQASSPGTIRFILSGQSDKDSILESINRAHIFLAKPCSQETLQAVLERAESLHRLIRHSSIENITTEIGGIPSIPILYDKLRNEIRSEDASIESIAEIVASDPAMASKVLQVVNSAFFCLPRNISSINEAVGILGLETISAMVLSEEVFRKIDPEIVSRFELDLLSKRAERVAAICRAVAKFEQLTLAAISAAYTSGLLADLGRVVLACYKPAALEEISNDVNALDVDELVAEQSVLGVPSCRIGAYILGLWGLPCDVVKGVAYHQVSELGTEKPGLTAILVRFSKAAEQFLSGGYSEFSDFINNNSTLSQVISEEKQRSWLDISKELIDA